MHVHVMPVAYSLDALDVIVSHVHSSCISNLSVDDHNLAMVARHNMVYPGETYRVKLDEVDA